MKLARWGLRIEIILQSVYYVRRPSNNEVKVKIRRITPLITSVALSMLFSADSHITLIKSNIKSLSQDLYITIIAVLNIISRNVFLSMLKLPSWTTSCITLKTYHLTRLLKRRANEHAYIHRCYILLRKSYYFLRIRLSKNHKENVKHFVEIQVI